MKKCAKSISFEAARYLEPFEIANRSRKLLWNSREYGMYWQSDFLAFAFERRATFRPRRRLPSHSTKPIPTTRQSILRMWKSAGYLSTRSSRREQKSKQSHEVFQFVSTTSFSFASSPRLHPNYQQKHFNSDSITPRRFAFINCKPSSALIDRCCFIFDCRKVIKHFSACFFVLSVFSFNDHSNPGLITYQYHRNFSSELKIELDWRHSCYDIKPLANIKKNECDLTYGSEKKIHQVAECENLFVFDSTRYLYFRLTIERYATGKKKQEQPFDNHFSIIRAMSYQPGQFGLGMKIDRLASFALALGVTSFHFSIAYTCEIYAQSLVEKMIQGHWGRRCQRVRWYISIVKRFVRVNSVGLQPKQKPIAVTKLYSSIGWRLLHRRPRRVRCLSREIAL